MRQSGEQAALEVIGSFQNEMAAVRNTPMVADLETQLTAIAYELSDTYMEFTDELSANLGADAANRCERSSDQNLAIYRCESFVSDEVNASAASFVAAVLVVNNLEDARELINKVVRESPAREASRSMWSACIAELEASVSAGGYDVTGRGPAWR